MHKINKLHSKEFKHQYCSPPKKSLKSRIHKYIAFFTGYKNYNYIKYKEKRLKL
jgi:hypothetical protein